MLFNKEPLVPQTEEITCNKETLAVVNRIYSECLKMLNKVKSEKVLILSEIDLGIPLFKEILSDISDLDDKYVEFSKGYWIVINSEQREGFGADGNITISLPLNIYTIFMELLHGYAETVSETWTKIHENPLMYSAEYVAELLHEIKHVELLKKSIL